MTATQARRIDEVAVVFNGKTPSKSEQRDGGHPVLKIKDVDALGRFRGMFSGYVDADLARKHVKQQLAGGETLVLNAAHSATHVASKTFYADQDVAGSLATGEWLIVRWSTEAVDSRYGNHWINVPDTRFRIRRLVNGIHLYPKDVARLQIPLPPLDQQKRIARILDAADALRAKRREALAQFDTLLQSTFLDMFGDPVTNPMGWEVVSVGDEISFLTSGSRGWAKYYAKEGDTFIRIQNLKGGQLDLDDTAFVNAPESAEAKRTTVEPGDVLLSITADLGRTGVVSGGIAKAHINQHLAILRFTSLNPVFVSYQLASKGGQAQFNRLNREGVKAGLNFNDVKSIRLTNPPLNLQHRFATIVESVEHQKASQRAHLAELDTLFASLQSRAFRGDL